MASLLGALAPRVRNDSPAPLVSRSASGRFSGVFSRRDAKAQLDMMALNGTVFGIVDKTSTAVAGVEWHLYRKSKTGKKEDRVEVTSHAALDLLNKPNAFFDRMTLLETAQQHLDLPGEAALLVARSGRSSLPLELWPIRPDRLDPVPHPTKYLTGWIYTSPDGEQVPLRIDEVIHIRRPNPVDPYRGLGPVGTVLTEIMSADYAARWNANFFKNDASPGGIIEVEKRLTDDEFDELTMRWEEQHRGVARAHRVAILEQGKWVDRKYSQRDMQFTDLRGVSRDAIMEAYGFPKSMLGITEDVNRAVAEAGKAVFAEWLTVPRLNRWRNAWNGRLLPLYGPDAAKTLEFDYESPVPEDREADNAERTSKATAAKTYIDAGYDGDSVKEALDLPDALTWEKPAPQPTFGHMPAGPEAAPGSEGAAVAEPGAPTEPSALFAAFLRGLPAAEEPHGTLSAVRQLVRNADYPAPVGDWPAEDPDSVDDVDLAPLQAAFETALATLVATWSASIVGEWISQLVSAIRAALGPDGDRSDLAYLTVDTAHATTTLADAMASFAQTAAGHAVAEASAAGVHLTAEWPTAADLEAAAREIAEFEGRRYALTASREAARVAGPEPDADAVASHTETFLNELSTAPTETALGGALTDAQNQGRLATFATVTTSGALYASEQMDSNTCKPCRAIHGRFIATTDDLTALFKLYPFGGYIDCLGRWRCRGTFVGVWRPSTTEGGQ
ncbi:phage portal protein [Amycolatopsis sp. NPDC004378]